MSGIAVICIRWGLTVRKSNSWEKAENSIVTVIKPELHILHRGVTGKGDSLDCPDRLRRHRSCRTHMLATENFVITRLKIRVLPKR